MIIKETISTSLIFKITCRFVFMVAMLVFGEFTVGAQQDSDHAYRIPLETALKEIELRFKVQIKYSESQVKGKWVNYGYWRFRSDLKKTLENVLAPLDLKVNKEKEAVYKLKEYEYYRWEPEDGWAALDAIQSKYNNLSTWEIRKSELRAELRLALKLDAIPNAPQSKPIFTPKRTYKGYTVENIAFEILPGVYLNGSLYKPTVIKSKIPLVLSPDGHWEKQRYRADAQIRCAMIAKMGAMAFSYDLFAWGESLLQFKPEDHRTSLAQRIQTLGALRLLDYFSNDLQIDTKRIGISGGSGAGSHSILMSAIDERITLSAPVVAMSSYFFGGCPCESGMPIHQCGGGTNNVEIAAMTAPRPQLLVSDGADWTAHTPLHDFPFLQRTYDFYNAKQNVENVHLPTEKHDFGINKRKALYQFLVKHFKLNNTGFVDNDGNYNETDCTIEPEKALYVFGDQGERLPKNALMGINSLEKLLANGK